jgi:hydrogenase maturation factor HypF (carbamoyltransferase family)
MALPHRGKFQKTTSSLFKMFLVPCSCGTTFAVAEDYDRKSTAWSRYLKCPNCGKRHDPKNRLLQLGYQREGYWKVDEC